MKTRQKAWRMAGAAALLMGLAGLAQAAPTNPAVLSIDVTVTASLSVSINGAGSSTQTATFTGTPNEEIVAPSSVAVQNNSGVLSEVWKLSSSNAYDSTSPGTDPWTLAASTASVGADSFAIQAVFGSSNTAAGACPKVATDANWDSATIAPALTTTPTQYTTTVYADPYLNTNGSYTPDTGTGLMYGGSTRALCWRMIGPASVSTTDGQIVTILVTAAP